MKTFALQFVFATCLLAGIFARAETPVVKYPSSLVFEGGQGDPWFDDQGFHHTPAWRLYLCIEKTETPLSGKVVLDFNRLGQGPEVVEGASAQKLKSVVLNYTYTTDSLKIESQQDWSLHESFFDVQTDSGTLAQYEQYLYPLGGQDYYMTHELHREQRTAACERENKPWFFEVAPNISK